ncbi:hypothetical protein ABIB25_003455 [Nakamurella sp. UYEF19]
MGRLGVYGTVRWASFGANHLGNSGDGEFVDSPAGPLGFSAGGTKTPASNVESADPCAE